MTAAVTIESTDWKAANGERPALVALLEDTVSSGASIGFLPPLKPSEATQYWASVAAALREGSRRLLVAREAGANAIYFRLLE